MGHNYLVTVAKLGLMCLLLPHNVHTHCLWPSITEPTRLRLYFVLMTRQEEGAQYCFRLFGLRLICYISWNESAVSLVYVRFNKRVKLERLRAISLIPFPTFLKIRYRVLTFDS